MTQATARVNYLGASGLVQSVSRGSWDYIYRTSTVIDAKWRIGDRVVLPDGREFRYAKSASVLNTSEACHHTAAGTVAYTSAIESVAIGETTVTVPAATHSALTQDELAGGFVVIFGSVADGADMMFRGITGNPASDADAALTLFLDGELDVAIDTSSAYEVYANPWAAMEHTSGSPSAGKAGPPAAYVSATDTYFWCQVAGPVFQNPQATVIGNEGLGVNWRADGSLDAVATALTVTVPDASTTQYAGHRMMGNYDDNGPIIWMIN